MTLIGNFLDIQAVWTESTFKGYAGNDLLMPLDSKRKLVDFDNYKATLKRTWMTEKVIKELK